MTAPHREPDIFYAIVRCVSSTLPEIEVFDARIVGTGTQRVLIDHPTGIHHGHCSDVAKALGTYAERYALEISSPGLPRPLLRPEHYERAIGERAELTLHDLLDGRRRLAGTIERLHAGVVTLGCESGEAVDVPLAAIRKAHLHHELLIPDAPRPGRPNRS